jgi:hypothetical protein
MGLRTGNDLRLAWTSVRPVRPPLEHLGDHDWPGGSRWDLPRGKYPWQTVPVCRR